MRPILMKIIALCLVLCLTLSGCAFLDLGGYFENLMAIMGGVTDFADMQYRRPDLDAMESTLEQACAAAATETYFPKLEEQILAFYEHYYAFSTAYALATIYYCQDLTDSGWEEEYNFCLTNASAVDAALDRLYRELAKSPLRSALEGDDYFGAGFFDYYEGETIYDETFLSLLEQEALLQAEYYDISGEASAVEYYSEEYFSVYGTQMARVLVDLIALRQQMAAYLGYGSYPEFAYDYYHTRDYTPAQATSYLADIRAELAPMYKQLMESGFWNRSWSGTTTEQTFGYVETMAGAMGGLVGDAFDMMKEGNLYDIAPGLNKFNASFEIYIADYYQPYIFMNPTLSVSDKLTFAHEFGHFCNDYASSGSAAGVDVAEVFSQGMEYLSLFYAEDSSELKTLKMADCLSIYVEQAALASFEQQMYGLTGDDLTEDGLRQLYASVCAAYGMDGPYWDSRSFVVITHFYTSPLYVISYVVSNDAALQLYQLEAAQSGMGLACLEESLATTEAYFLAFLDEAGLESPFVPGRISRVKDTLQSFFP